MYYRCTKCNAAHQAKTRPAKCDRCGHTELQRTERMRYIVTGEYYRSGSGKTWMLNDDRTEFVDDAKKLT